MNSKENSGPIKILIVLNFIVATLAMIYILIFSTSGFMDFSRVSTYYSPLVSISSIIVNWIIIKYGNDISNSLFVSLVSISIILTMVIFSPIVYAYIVNSLYS